MSLIPQIGGAVERINGKLYLRVTQAGSPDKTVTFDAVTTQYPDAITEIYEYRQGGLVGTIVVTITVTYLTSAKQLLDNVVWTVI
ncbi:MAG: hypothetical protein HRT70_01310 [Flavobacteriaceae bacterium]|nr:hypothetical protein [Flavobacteriaceae bacterium]